MLAFLKKYFKYLILLLLLYLPIFGHLGSQPIRIWDEARLAINAYEMSKDGSLIVTHFDGKPDMWNTKPPLLIWIQAALIKIFGVNELAIRIPSAIAAILTMFAILIFLQKYTKSYWFGFIAVLVLLTSHGYINNHASRTGDYDAMLTLFTTLSSLSFFVFVEFKNNKFIYFFFILTALAVLTKSISGMLFLPGLALYSLIQKQIPYILKNKHFYFGLLTFIIPVAAYYLLRESMNPGYISAVAENELGGRFLKVIENNSRGFWYYYHNFIDFQMNDWYVLIPLGLLTGLFIKDNKINKLSIFLSLLIITFFLIISTSKTKLEWYDVPLYPFLAILIAISIYYIFNLLKDHEWINKHLRYNILPYIFIILIYFQPYQKIVYKTNIQKEYYWDKEFYEIGYFLKDAIKGKYNLDGKYLLYDGYNTQNLFYIKALNEKGINCQIKDWKNIQPNDLVFTHQPKIKEFITHQFETEQLFSHGNVVQYKILNIKSK